MRRAAAQAEAEDLRQQLRHFVKVTRSYRPGLFHCYASADVPRTNNDLEHLFGSHRYHERRASGRKAASPGLVVMGSVRIVAGLATRLRPAEGLELPAGATWRGGRRCARGWSNVGKPGDSKDGSAVLRSSTSRSWRKWLTS